MKNNLLVYSNLLKRLRRKFKTRKFILEYDKDNDFFYIHHNDSNLDSSQKFNKFVDILIYRIHKQGFKNFVISYDYELEYNHNKE